MSMRPPGPTGDAPLMMRREVTCFSHKAKRGLCCQPGKPLRGIRLKREQTMLGTDHHIVSLIAILNARDDMNRLARELGCRTRAGSRGGGLGGTTGRLGLLRRCRRARACRSSSLTPFLRPSWGQLCRGSCASASQRCSVLASMPRRVVAWATETKDMWNLLSCEAWNKNESQPGALPGKLPRMLLETGLRKIPRRTLRKTPGKSPGKARCL